MTTKRNRKRKPNSRRDKQEKRRVEKLLKSATEGFVHPNERIQRLRSMFSFFRPTQDGKGEIDQDIHDPIGRLHAVGLLDGHGHDPLAMRDQGRTWGNHLAALLNGVGGCKIATYERASKSNTMPVETRADREFDHLDAALTRTERAALFELIVTPQIAINPNDMAGPVWAEVLIAHALRDRHGVYVDCAPFPSDYEQRSLEAVIRGLNQLVDASLAPLLRRAA